MKTYIVGYDLNHPVQNYSELIEAIKRLGKWWHYLDSTWIIKSDRPAADIRDELQAHVDANDELLVAALTGESAWVGFDQRASSWLKENIQPS